MGLPDDKPASFCDSSSVIVGKAWQGVNATHSAKLFYIHKRCLMVDQQYFSIKAANAAKGTLARIHSKT